MNALRKVEIFSDSGTLSMEPIALIDRLSCPSCEIQVRNMNEPAVAQDARRFGVTSLPAVVVNGKVVTSTSGGELDEGALRAAGIGQGLA